MASNNSPKLIIFPSSSKNGEEVFLSQETLNEINAFMKAKGLNSLDPQALMSLSAKMGSIFDVIIKNADSNSVSKGASLIFSSDIEDAYYKVFASRSSRTKRFVFSLLGIVGGCLAGSALTMVADAVSKNLSTFTLGSVVLITIELVIGVFLVSLSFLNNEK